VVVGGHDLDDVILNHSKEVGRRVVMVDMVGVILRLAFTWLPPWSDGVTEQRLAATLQVLRIHSQEVLFVLSEMARHWIDGAEIDDCGVDGAADGHDRDPGDEVGLSPLDVVIHDGAATVILGMIPSDRHGRLGAVQHADRTARFARLGEWASGEVRSVHLKRSSQTKDVSGSDVDVVALASSESSDRVREHVDGQIGDMNPINAGGITDFDAVASDSFTTIEQRLAPFNNHESPVVVLDSQWASWWCRGFKRASGNDRSQDVAVE